MKLHLPKSLLCAVMATLVMSTGMAIAFDGPNNVQYNEISQNTSGNISATSNTKYTSINGNIDSLNAANCHVILSTSGAQNEVTLSGVNAESIWITQGKFSVNENSDLTNAGDIYLGGGTLQLLGELTYDNNFVLGASSFDGNWKDNYNNIKNAAILLGHWQTSVNKASTINGTVTVQENARIALQEGCDLNLTGSLSGSANLFFGHFHGDDSASIVHISGDTAGYSGSVSLQSDGGNGLTLKLTGKGTSLLNNSITMGASTMLDVALGAAELRKIEANVTASNNDGYIKITTNHSSSQEVKFNGTENKDIALTKNYEFIGNFSVHAGGQSAAVRVKDGTIKANSQINLIAGGKLIIEGGDVITKAVSLGHTSKGDYPGHLQMTDGSLTAEAIKIVQNERVNTVNISGGTLEFTTADALVNTNNTNKTSTIHIGASGDKSVILKATTTNWKLDRGVLNDGNLTIGNVTIDAANTEEISIVGAKFNGTVTNNAKLTITDAKSENVTLTGDGTTTITGSTDVDGTLTAKSGSVYFGKGSHDVGILDASISGKSAAAIKLGDSAQVNVSSQLWACNNSSIEIEKGASITNGVINIAGTNDTAASISAGKDAQYSAGSVDYTISNASVTITSSDNITYSNILDGSSLTNKGTGTVTTTNGNSNFSGIHAINGNINLTWFNEQKHQLLIESLSISEGRAVSSAMHKNLTSLTDRATLNVKDVTMRAGASLNSNLEICDNGSLTLDLTKGALTLSGILTLGTEIKLDDTSLSLIKGLDAGERLDLFTGVAELNLKSQSEVTESITLAALSDTSFSDAANYFSGLSSNLYTVGIQNGVVFVEAAKIPEPTTATLSLLSLAALAARRRRK
ncbi:MAG: hypothetical protein IKZ13_08945 [Akkermansia sp.]|nr:hypothetical protein [Akkermansia sp.]